MASRIEIGKELCQYLTDPENLPRTVEVQSKLYVPQEIAGSGFKAVVWQVVDEFGRKRALKLAIYEDYEDKAYLAEFTRAARLEESTAFAKFIDGGIIQLPGPGGVSCKFVASINEWVDGETLPQFIDSHPEAVTGSFFSDYVASISSALEVLKENRLIHDDLRPENVMLMSKKTGINNSELVLKVVDMGSLKERPTVKDIDDHGHVIRHLVLIWNAMRRRRVLSIRDRRFLDAAKKLIITMLEEDPSIVLEQPNLLREQFALSLARSSGQGSDERGRLNSPFEFISAEHIADDRLLVDIFASSCPWLDKVSGPDPVLVTGPRGCGKSTIFRWLSLKARVHQEMKDLDSLRILGFYVSCSADLQSRLSWVKTSQLAERFSREVIHYFSLIIAREVAQTLERISRRPDRESAWGFSKKQEIDFREFILSRTSHDARPSVFGISPIQQTIEYLESEIFSTHRNLERRLNADSVLGEAFISELSSAVIAAIPAFASSRKVAYLIDDFSVHRIPDPLQRILNRVIWARSAEHVFKLSSEKHGAILLDSAGAQIDSARELLEVDAGTEYFEVDRNARQVFVSELLNNRLAAAKYSANGQTLIGDSRWPEGSLAKALVTRTGKKGLDHYHGLECIADLCSGDVATLLLVLRRILEESGTNSESHSLIDVRIQHRVIQQVSRDLLSAVRDSHIYGQEMFEIANSFGKLIRVILFEGAAQTDGSPTQSPRIEIDQAVGAALDSLNPHQRNVAVELIRRAIFIEFPLGRSRHQGQTTLRWQIRSIYLPAFGVALSKNDAIKRGPDWLQMFISNPELACDSVWKSWRRNSGSGGFNSQMTFLSEVEGWEVGLDETSDL
jgi:serine/threonine protein kinase